MKLSVTAKEVACLLNITEEFTHLGVEMDSKDSLVVIHGRRHIMIEARDGKLHISEIEKPNV